MNTQTIHRITLGRLNEFLSGPDYERYVVKPISRQRAQSYLRNPHASISDVVLYYIVDDEQIIAFRTIWADKVQTLRGVVKFGWCSGTWVHPGMRRKGLSQLLLREAYSDWNMKLMFTNYAPQSLEGNLKTQLFKAKIERIGMRFYLMADYKKLLQQKTRNAFTRFVALIGANIIKPGVNLKLKFYKQPSFDGFLINETEHYTNDFFDDRELGKSLFVRHKSNYEWIFAHRWITLNTTDKQNYPFSLFRTSFRYFFIKMHNSKNVSARLIVSVSDGNAKLLYASAPDYMQYDLMKYLVFWSAGHKIKTLTVVDPFWAGIIENTPSPFLIKKPFSMHIFSTFDFDYDKSMKIHAGDGDYIFT